MTAILFLLGASLAGAGLVRRVAGRLLDGAERALCGVVIGWMLSTLAAYAISRATGRLTFGTALAALALVCLAAPALFAPELKRLLLERRPRGRQTKRRLRVPNQSHAFLLLVLALFAPIYLRLFRTHMLAPGADGVYSAGSTWYDLGLHLAISTSFLHGHNFPPVYTPLPPEPLLYPFLPDFQTALLAALGLSLRAALIVTSVPLALALTGLFYSFARRILQDWNTPDATTSTPRAAALATILFLLNGGLGFLYLHGDWQQSGKSLFEFWSSPTVNYANMGDRRIQWTNLIADTLLPQRASLYGLSAAFIVFTAFVIFWRGCSNEDGKTNARRDANERDATERRDVTKRLSFLAFFSGERWSGWRVLLPAGVLTGLLPFFHTHTYAAVGLVSGFLFLLRPRRAWLAFWLPAVLLAAPHFANLSGHVSAHGFLRFQPGWRGHNEPNWPLYWLRNVGVPTLLIVPALIAAPRAWRVFYLAFVALLAFALVVVVSPNDYDNIKLMYYWHAATSVLVAAWLVRLASVHRQRLAAFLLALLCTASGLLALRFESADRKLLFSNEELSAADFARTHAAPRALFLTAPTVHQPVLSLAGRPVLRADTAWLWSHGYDFTGREADVRAVYAGREDARQLLDYYRVDYVYFGRHERELSGADESYFEQNFPAVFRSDTVRVYDVRPPTARSLPDDGTAKLLEPFPPREYAARLERDPAQLLVEFPRAAFAVYRYHRVAFGRRPRYREFIEDMRAVGRDLRVGAHGWHEVLERNKRALTDALVERDDFKSRHEGETAEQFVGALYANAGLAPSRAERERLAADLSSGRELRAGLLRRVAEHRALRARDYDDAYVLMHYFGYLRRDPDAPPDKDLGGFNFWLADLRRTGDYRSVSRVFIESGEYKDRGKRQK